MTVKTERAYLAWQRAVRASENKALRNAPETYSDAKRRWARIATLKERYETALAAEKEKAV